MFKILSVSLGEWWEKSVYIYIDILECSATIR